MRLIVDTNCLIAAILKDGGARAVLRGKHVLLSPRILLEELAKHRAYLVMKSGAAHVHRMLALLLERVELLALEENLQDSRRNL